jgi:hypothetical protein
VFGTLPPSTTKVDITSIEPDAVYYGAVTYVVSGAPGDRLVLGPVTAGSLSAAVGDGDYGDVTVSGGGTTFTIDATAEAERIRDVMGTALVAGSNVTVTVNDAGDTITIAGTYAPPVASSQSGTSYTAVIGDANTFIRFTSASSVTFTIPPNSSVAFPVDTEIHFSQSGAGALSVAAGSGVTINSRSSDLTLAGQYAVAFVKKVSTDTWLMNGDL